MSEESRNFEQEARQEGWRPQEEWKGDPDKWVDAQTFVERGEKISGILKSKVERLEQRLERAERANQKFGEYHKKTIERERQQAEQTIAALEKKIEQAISEGDGQAYTQYSRQVNDLKNNLPKGEDFNSDDGFAELAQSWLADNQWYNSDPTLATFADGAADRLRAQGFTGKAYFDELTRLVKNSFPDKFENPNRKRESNVDLGDPPDEAPVKKRSYKALPADAKKACDEFVAQGFMTREQYVDQYDWEDE